MPRFTGSPAETLAFLEGIEANNDRRWFDAHRGEYERYWLEPARGFVGAAGRHCRIAPGVVAEPRVNGSILRINRDTRFSKEATQAAGPQHPLRRLAQRLAAVAGVDHQPLDE